MLHGEDIIIILKTHGEKVGMRASEIREFVTVNGGRLQISASPKLTVHGMRGARRGITTKRSSDGNRE